MRTKICTLGLICFFVFISGCKKQLPTSPDIPDFQLPLIYYFKSSATNTGALQTRTLKWQVVRATKVEIDNGIGEVALEGMKEIDPYEKTTYVLTATNNDGQVQKTLTAGDTDVIMVSGPTSDSDAPFWTYIVRGEVKNIGSMPALNTRISIELYSGNGYGPAGELLRSAEKEVNNGIVKPQQQVGWSFTWDDSHQKIDFRMREGEIKYEITWEDG